MQGGVRPEPGVGYLRNEWDSKISLTRSAKPGNGSISPVHRLYF